MFVARRVLRRAATAGRGVFQTHRTAGNEFRPSAMFTSKADNEHDDEYAHHVPSRTAEEAVNNILYNTPMYKDEKTQHVLSVLVDNEVGILSKISGLLSARGYNIDSLSVSNTDVKELSRMTIKVMGHGPQIEQCRRQLEDLVNVWAVVDYTDVSHLDRELVLVKVSTEGLNKTKKVSDDPLIANHFRRAAVLEIAKLYEAKVTDIGAESIVLELVAWSQRCDAFIRMMQPHGIIECARSGAICMSRARVGPPPGSETKSVREAVDLASLPPS